MSNLQNQNQQNQDPTMSQEDSELLNQENQPSAEPTNQPATSAPTPRVYTEEEMRTVHDLYGQTLRENERRLQEAQASNSQQNNQPQRNPQDDDFLTNGRDIVAQEIDKRLEPFAKFIETQQAQTVYAQLKDQFKKHPNFAQFFNIPNAEFQLDQQFAQAPAASVNVQSIAGAISQIFGFMTLNGQVPQAQINNQQQPINQPVNQPNTMSQSAPPHLRPSAPPMPTSQQNNLTSKGNPRRQLTELERRVARENKLDDDGYIDWLNESSNNVAFSDIGQEKK